MNFTPNLALAEVSAANHTPRRDTKTPSPNVLAFSCRGPCARRPVGTLAQAPLLPLILPLDSGGSALQWCIRTDEPFRFEPSGEFPHVPAKA